MYACITNAALGLDKDGRIPDGAWADTGPPRDALQQPFRQSAEAGCGSNVIMLAKSNLNNDPCTYREADACTSASTGCCPRNDVVYDYLLAQTAPGTN